MMGLSPGWYGSFPGVVSDQTLSFLTILIERQLAIKYHIKPDMQPGFGIPVPGSLPTFDPV